MSWNIPAPKGSAGTNSFSSRGGQSRQLNWGVCEQWPSRLALRWRLRQKNLARGASHVKPNRRKRQHPGGARRLHFFGTVPSPRSARLMRSKFGRCGDARRACRKLDSMAFKRPLRPRDSRYWPRGAWLLAPRRRKAAGSFSPSAPLPLRTQPLLWPRR